MEPCRRIQRMPAPWNRRGRRFSCPMRGRTSGSSSAWQRPCAHRGSTSGVDTEGLFVGEEFWERIRAVIDRASAVICVLSPPYARSDWCRREVEYAAERSKRIVPIVMSAVGTSQLPEPVRVRNWLSFTSDDEFEQPVAELIAAIMRDPAWIHEHTRLFARASDWERWSRSASLLLRDQELEEAKRWLASAGEREPRVHPLHVEIIEASDRADLESQREAQARRQVSMSRALVSRAEQLLARTDDPTLLPALLAAHAFCEDASAEAYAVLRRALRRLPPCRPRLEHPYRVGVLEFSPDGALVATAPGLSRKQEQSREYATSARGPNLEDVDERSLGMSRLRAELEGRDSTAFEARVWDISSGELRASLPHADRVRALAFASRGRELITACEDGTVRLWTTDGLERRTVARYPGPAWCLAVAPDGGRLLVMAEESRDGLGDLAAHVVNLPDSREELRIPLGGWDAGGPFLQRELLCIAHTTDLDLFAAAFSDGSLKVTTLPGGATLSVIHSQSPVRSMKFRPGAAPRARR